MSIINKNNNSNNRLMPQSFHKNVNLKVLYTFDDKNTFLARSNSPILAKIITLPNQPPHNGIEIGCIQLKECLDLLQSISPEWFQKGMDYSIYYKDIIEYDEPYVGSGLYSKIISSSNDTIITGRLSTNFLNLFQGSNSPADTLDIKLRLSPIHSISRTTTSANNNNNNNVSINKRKQDDSYSLYTENINNSSSPLDEHTHIQQQQQQSIQQRKRMRKSSIINTNNSSNNIIINNLKNNAPQLASRTQSLPFITEDSLAHRIRISDMITSKVDEEIDASGEPIASRFSNFPKNIKNEDDGSQPTKARKSKSFIQSVVKIGDNAVSSKNKKTPALASVFEHSSKKCVNCMSTSTPPYKFHKDGIFHCGNSGYLCSICNFYQSKNDLKSLRDRGEMGLRGLLDDPYNNKQISSATNTNSKRMKKKRFTNSSNPNSSIMENSSSPVFSSPMNLQNGFTTKSKKQINSNLSVNTTNKQTHETIHEVDNFKHEDLMALLKLESTFANYKSTPNILTNQSTELDPIEDMFRMPDSHSGNNCSSSASSSKGQQSKNNTPNENSEEYYRDFDNIPLDATKLNTTLIPIDDDDKENYPPSNMPPPNINIYHSNKTSSKESKESMKDDEKDHIHNLFGANDFSPSIQRIIESFSNEPSSPTKTTTTEWNYNFFEEDEEDISENDGTSSSLGNTRVNQNTECDDPEIERILAQANNQLTTPNATSTVGTGTAVNIHNINNNTEKYEITPRDPGTAQTQQNGDSPNGLKMTPGSSAFDMHMSSASKSKGSSANNNVTPANTTTKDIMDKKKESSSSKDKKNRLTMPSSPFFQIHNEGELTKDDKTLDTTESLINWDAKSSPVTEPLSSSYNKQ